MVRLVDHEPMGTTAACAHPGKLLDECPEIMRSLVAGERSQVSGDIDPRLFQQGYERLDLWHLLIAADRGDAGRVRIVRVGGDEAELIFLACQFLTKRRQDLGDLRG